MQHSLKTVFFFLTFGIFALITSCSSTKPLDLSGELSDEVSSGLATEIRGSDSGEVEGLSSINFGYDQSSLDWNTKNMLSKNAEWMKRKSDVQVQIEGHCDNRGSLEYNLSLGERRAEAVKNYLIGLGVSPSQLTTISYGKERLLAVGDGEEAHAKNRRVNFLILR